MSAPATAGQYRVKGITDDVTTCEQCGRARLKKTVALAPLDADGNEEGVIYVGVDCAARLAGRTQTAVRNAAGRVDLITEQARRWADEMGDYYGTAVTTEAIARYSAANRYSKVPADDLAALLAEMEAVRQGNLAVTRFARDMNKITLGR